jgi:hypothetical protein
MVLGRGGRKAKENDRVSTISNPSVQVEDITICTES